ANELLGMVRPGQDTIMGWFAQMSVVSAVNVFQHWGVFDLIPSQPGVGISFWKLAEKVGVEEGLLIRMSWMLTSSSVLWYFPPSTAGSHKGSLAHTPTSLLLRSQSPLSSMFKLLHTNIVETSAIMPSYFDTYGRKEPVGPGHIPTSYLAGQPELAYFDLLNQDPQRVKEFTHAMSIQHRRSPITGMFDLTSVIALAEQMEQSRKPQAEERPIWVDIGGSDGAVVKTFREKYPGLKPEWCVVQDLPQVVEAAREAAKDDALLKGVRFYPLDFHNEAPVEGALVYYLRNVVRDYSDPVVINILANIRKSMVPPSSSTDSGPGTAQAASRILISEQLIPSPPPLYAAFKDYAMLVVGGKERSLKQFEAVAEAAGLVITGVYRDNGTPHAVIEMQFDETASLVVGSSSFCLKCGGVVQRHDAQMDL
ncbi:S-adenosyl-L-methionine-dependent methyltransferase, partial [Rhypophila decipiens]